LQGAEQADRFPDANHWIMKGEDSRFWYSQMQAWLAKWLK